MLDSTCDVLANRPPLSVSSLRVLIYQTCHMGRRVRQPLGISAALEGPLHSFKSSWVHLLLVRGSLLESSVCPFCCGVGQLRIVQKFIVLCCLVLATPKNKDAAVAHVITVSETFTRSWVKSFVGLLWMYFVVVIPHLHAKILRGVLRSFVDDLSFAWTTTINWKKYDIISWQDSNFHLPELCRLDQSQPTNPQTRSLPPGPALPRCHLGSFPHQAASSIPLYGPRI
jgi:hypothetical protein